ncbi:hypothetical protein DTO271D3_3285 [Paecilomyces variotii]|nr:hypothetical protein DTO271D3_3285 [Paecilomyces variotii]
MTMIFLCRSRFDDNLYDHLMRGFVSYTGVDLTLIKDYRIASVSGTLLIRKRLQENDNACVQRGIIREIYISCDVYDLHALVTLE